MKLYKTEKGTIINISQIKYISPDNGENGWDYGADTGNYTFALTKRDLDEILKLAKGDTKITDVFDQIRKWSDNHKLNEFTDKQVIMLIEEDSSELKKAYKNQNFNNLCSIVGDMVVGLTILAHKKNINIEDTIHEMYNTMAEFMDRLAVVSNDRKNVTLVSDLQRNGKEIRIPRKVFNELDIYNPDSQLNSLSFPVLIQTLMSSHEAAAIWLLAADITETITEDMSSTKYTERSAISHKRMKLLYKIWKHPERVVCEDEE